MSGICLTQLARVLRSHVGRVCLAREEAPASAGASGTRASRAAQGNRPPGCYQSDYPSEADSHLR